MAYEVFISYSHEDREWANRLARDLKDGGVTVYDDRNSVRDGEGWEDQLNVGLIASKHLVCFWSKRAHESPWVQMELGTFRSKMAGGKTDSKLIMVPLDATPHAFARIHTIEIPALKAAYANGGVQGVSNTDWIALVDRIVRAVQPAGAGPRVPSGSWEMEHRPTVKPPTTSKLTASSPDVAAPPDEQWPRDRVFVSYAHKDERWFKRLQVHLRPLEREGRVDFWSDTRIAPGADWRAEIESALERATVAILLISADYLASDFVASHELPQMLAAAQQHGLVVLPVIVGPSQFTSMPELSRFQSVNGPDRPLLALRPHDRETILCQVTDVIRDRARIRGHRSAPPTRR